MAPVSPSSAIVTISCPDMKGIVVSVTEFVFKNNGNILSLDQHVDTEEKTFFMRVEWDLTGFTIPPAKIGEYFQTLIADRYSMSWQLSFSNDTPRMAIFVSRYAHCLYDILSRWQSGEWKIDIPLIISNHDALQPVAEKFSIPFSVVPITEATKQVQEDKELALLREYRIDFIVLARYMQVISNNFISHYVNNIINIHHSFLPAFAGSKPYHAAYARGVKIVGATSHYVTPDLDQGPIIDQDVIRVSHIDTVDELVRKGRDLEKLVLSRAIHAHIQRKTLVYKNRTVVFG